MNISRSIPVGGLVAGPALFAVGDLLRRVVVPDSNASTADTVAAVSQHPGLWQAAALASLAGSMLAAPGVLALTGRVTGRGSRLVRFGGGLFALGWLASIAHAVGFFGLYGVYASSTADASSVASLDAAADRYAPLTAVIILFMAGAIVGQLVWFVGLARARLVPAWVVLAAVVDVVAGGTGGLGAGVVGLVAWLVACTPAARALAGRWAGPVVTTARTDVAHVEVAAG